MTLLKMHKAALCLYGIYQFQQYKVTHYCMGEIGQDSHLLLYCVICWQTMSMRYRNEKDKTVLQHCIAQTKKKYNT